jgi:hypothetical protein
MNILSGWKTHLLVLAGLITVGAMFVGGDLTLAEAIQRALEVASISGLRLGVAAAGAAK